LDRNDFRFLRIKPQDKRPVDEWRKNNFSVSDKTLQDWIENGGNYGILCGEGGLLVIDIDNEKYVKEIKERLPRTFTIKTAKGYHFYYICPDFEKKIILKKDGEHVGECQWKGQYVVAPGSVHPSGAVYKIDSCLPVIEVKQKEILKALRGYIKVKEKNAPIKKPNSGENKLGDGEIKQIIEMFVPIWRPGVRNQLTMSLCGAMLKARVGHEQIKEVIYNIAEKSNDEELKERLKNVDYHIEKLIGGDKKLHELMGLTGVKEVLKLFNFDKGKTRAFINSLHSILWKYEDFFDEEGRFKPHLMAEAIKERFVFKTTFDSGDIYFYEDGIYRPNGENLIKKICEEWYPEITKRQKEEVIAHIEHSTYFKREEIDKDPNKIHLKNGIYLIDEERLIDFTPDIIAINKIPVKYNKNADCPKIKKFLSEILTEDDIPVIQELFGYLLYKKHFIHKAFMFLGDGSNGKSTLINLMKHFVGHENICSVALQELVANRFAMAQLYGKLVNLYADLSPRALYDTGKFKLLTGQDTVTAERKFKNPFTFVSYAKHVFSANKLPESRDKTRAFFRRWVIINFPNTFDDNTADPDILEKITTEEEMSGLFNWAIEGLKRLIKNKKFTHSKTAEETEEMYLRLSDSLSAFCMDCVSPNPENEISKDDFYQYYVEYCSAKNLPVCSKIEVGRKLPTITPVSVSRPIIDNKRTTCWKGLEISWDNFYEITKGKGKINSEQKEIQSGVVSPWHRIESPADSSLEIEEVDLTKGGMQNGT